MLETSLICPSQMPRKTHALSSLRNKTNIVYKALSQLMYLIETNYIIETLTTTHVEDNALQAAR